jgi:AdoMet-dependent heme synthase
MERTTRASGKRSRGCEANLSPARVARRAGFSPTGSTCSAQLAGDGSRTGVLPAQALQSRERSVSSHPPFSTTGIAPRHPNPIRRGGDLDFDDHPLLAIWEVTRACDLACAHCRACAIADRDPNELSTDEGQRLLARLGEMHVPLLVLTGGDPAKRPDLVELVEAGTRAGLTVAVTPSGTPLLQRDDIIAMRDAGLARLAISVDGPDEDSHDSFRGVRGSFSETMRILREARELGVPLQINTSVGPHNLKAVRRMAELVREVGAVMWSVFLVVPVGRAGLSLLLTRDRVELLLLELAELPRLMPFDIKTTAAPHFRRILLQEHAKKATVGVLDDVGPDGVVRGMRGINDGVGFLFVSHTGDICPSGFLPLPAGNVRTDDVAEVYRHSPLFMKLRDVDSLGGKCGVCPFRRVCGGSRARAFASTQDIMAEDPLCAYVPRGWVKK